MTEGARRTTLVLGLGGLAVAGGLVADFDSAAIGSAFAVLGGKGVLALILYRLIPAGLCALAWRVLAPEATLSAFVAARLSRDGVASLLPLMPAGGEVVGARMLTLAGIEAVVAVAATIGDVTLEVASQSAFTLFGVAALTWVLPDGGSWGWIAVALSLPVLLGLALVQHPRVMGLLEALALRLAKGADWAVWLGDGALSRALSELYRQPGLLAGGFLLHLVAWLVGTGEAWLALRLMGVPLDFANVVALEAIVFALRSVAFAIPWAVGVQEGGYLALGVALGLPAEIALTLSLVKRLPDIALGLVGLLLWRRRERPPILAN